MHGLQGDEPGGVVDIVAQAGQPLTGDAGERGPDHGALTEQLEQIEPRLGAPHLGLGPLDVRRCGGLVGQQSPGPGQGLLGQVAIGLGPVHLGLELTVVHLEERSPLGHQRAFPDHDLDQTSVDFGAQLDRLERLDLSRGGDGIHHRVGADQHDLHRDRSALPPAGAAATGGGCGIGPSAAAGECCQCGESHTTVCPHRGSLSLKSRRPRMASSPARARRAA